MPSNTVPCRVWRQSLESGAMRPAMTADAGGEDDGRTSFRDAGIVAAK